MKTYALAGAALLALSAVAVAQDAKAPDPKADPKDAAPAPAPAPRRPSAAAAEREAAEAAAKKAAAEIESAVARGMELILGLQEGDGNAEWPYEGVYRVRGEIPIGYRVGGTAISAAALLLAPGYAESVERQEAVARAASFICGSITHELMAPDYDASYDVRGWGYTYGLDFLLRLKAAGATPAAQQDAAEKAIGFFIDAIHRTEIPQVGGWNYSRPGRKDGVSPPSPFMTAPTLQALFEARKQGYTVDDAVVTRALDYLESSRAPSGAVVYAGKATERSRDGVPGAVGRMVATEATLLLAGRGSPASVRAAIDAFIVHWEWLDKRRAKTGTHVAPYSVAPYYFYFAHYHAAQAVELLPQRERAEYRRRINALLFSVRLEDGSWNDRVFPRSANFGTSMATMALLMPELPRPAAWESARPAP